MKMRFFGWAEAFKDEKALEKIDFVESVHRLEVTYWIFMGIGLLFVMIGLTTAQISLLQGLVLMISGMLDIVIVKIWVHIRLAMYWILFDHRCLMNLELRRSQAVDL